MRDKAVERAIAQRLLDKLDAVHKQDPAYDEVHVLGHSLGTVIAVDALAEYGDASGNITLHTWGSMLSLLASQEPLIEQEIEKYYTNPQKLSTWIDVSFWTDILSSPRPLPRKFVDGFSTSETHDEIFPATIRPRMPWQSLFSKYSTHASYFRSDAAILMLIRPKGELDALK